MFTTGNTHLKYRKHRVHSAAHKLKIRSSRLVLTTAGTDLDSTDRAAIGGAKNSSASEPLKRPILSLWNSRVALCETSVPEQLDLSEADVVTSFSRLNLHKASGPDGLKGRTLKNCATQLGKIFTLIFQSFLDSHVMPRAWKTSTIIPVPKKATPLQLNDYRPVALTPIIAKCFEKVVSKHLKFDVVDQLDPFQFAYKASRGVEDASFTLLNLITQHLDKAKSYV